MEWLEVNKFIITLKNLNTNSNKIYQIRKTLNILHKYYPTPTDWLTKTEKVSITKFSDAKTSELWYLVYWAWESKIYIDLEFSEILLNHFLSISKDAKQVFYWWANNLNLITQVEVSTINRMYKKVHARNIIKCISALCLFTMKPFKEINIDEITGITTTLLERNNVSTKTIQEVRFALDYSKKIPKITYKNLTKNKLIGDPLNGMVFSEFHKYLLLANTRESFQKNMWMVLNHFMDFLKIQKKSDCSHFIEQDYINLTNYLLEKVSVSSTMLYISKLKKFFEWGYGDYSFFPNELRYPIDLWKQLNKKAKIENSQSDGHAFKKDESAQLIVNALKNFKPQNEFEEACMTFWLIIASAPSRASWILSLEAHSALQPLPNEPDALGLYSINYDKRGKKHGHVPFLDSIGLEHLKVLQNKVIDGYSNGIYKKIYNESVKAEYLHLFSLPASPWLLTKSHVYDFFRKNIEPLIPNWEKIEGGAKTHSFRHYLLTEIVKRTGEIGIAQTAALHDDHKMTNLYVRSKIARKALLFRAIEKFDNKEITGKFYFKLIELMTSKEIPSEDMFIALTTEMTLNEFIAKYGRRKEMGYCMGQIECDHFEKCWSCPHFLMTKDEISSGIQLLSNKINELNRLKKSSKDFSYNNAISKSYVTAVILISKRIMDLGVSHSDLFKMIDSTIGEIKLNGY